MNRGEFLSDELKLPPPFVAEWWFDPSEEAFLRDISRLRGQINVDVALLSGHRDVLDKMGLREKDVVMEVLALDRVLIELWNEARPSLSEETRQQANYQVLKVNERLQTFKNELQGDKEAANGQGEGKYPGYSKSTEMEACCPTCGRVSEQNARFCPSCGTPLSGDQSSGARELQQLRERFREVIPLNEEILSASRISAYSERMVSWVTRDRQTSDALPTIPQIGTSDPDWIAITNKSILFLLEGEGLLVKKIVYDSERAQEDLRRLRRKSADERFENPEDIYLVTGVSDRVSAPGIAIRAISFVTYEPELLPLLQERAKQVGKSLDLRGILHQFEAHIVDKRCEHLIRSVDQRVPLMKEYINSSDILKDVLQ